MDVLDFGGFELFEWMVFGVGVYEYRANYGECDLGWLFW